MPARGPNKPPSLIWAQPAPPPARRLSRDAIVSAAIAVADRGGATALTMAAVAAELGSYTAMALYRHVPSKDALVDLMIDAVAGEIEPEERPEPDWRAELRAIAHTTWEMVMRHTWFATLVHSRPPLGPNMLRRTEYVLSVLTRQGATIDEAMTYAALLDTHIIGAALQASEEQSMQRRYQLRTPEELTDAIGEARALVAADRYPLLSAWMARPAVAGPGPQFELSLTFLLDGIAGRLPAASRT